MLLKGKRIKFQRQDVGQSDAGLTAICCQSDSDAGKSGPLNVMRIAYPLFRSKGNTKTMDGVDCMDAVDHSPFAPTF